MKRFLVLLVPFLLFAQTPKSRKPIPVVKPGPTVGMAAGSRYCGGGLAFLPDLTFREKLSSFFHGYGKVKKTVHVDFVHVCASANPGAKTVTWMWYLKIEDITDPSDTISNLRTLNETAAGMDIEGIAGHTINWTLTIR